MRLIINEKEPPLDIDTAASNYTKLIKKKFF
jgi:hypothetical protein